MSDPTTPPPPSPPPSMPYATPGPLGPIEMDANARTWALIAHLSPIAGSLLPIAGNIVAPLIVWLIKKDEMPFVDDQGKEALNFQISLSIVLFICLLLCFVFIGFLLLPIVGITGLVFTVLAAIKANTGERYRYPISIRFVR